MCVSESGCALGLRAVCIEFAAPAIAVATMIVTTSVHSAVDKLGEIDNEVLVLARSKREVENALEVDRRFYEHLHTCAKQCRYVISSPCARREG